MKAAVFLLLLLPVVFCAPNGQASPKTLSLVSTLGYGDISVSLSEAIRRLEDISRMKGKDERVLFELRNKVAQLERQYKDREEESRAAGEVLEDVLARCNDSERRRLQERCLPCLGERCVEFYNDNCHERKAQVVRQITRLFLNDEGQTTLLNPGDASKDPFLQAIGQLCKELREWFNGSVFHEVDHYFRDRIDGDFFKEIGNDTKEFFEDVGDFFKEDVATWFQEDLVDFFERDVADWFVNTTADAKVFFGEELPIWAENTRREFVDFFEKDVATVFQNFGKDISLFVDEKVTPTFKELRDDVREFVEEDVADAFSSASEYVGSAGETADGAADALGNTEKFLRGINMHLQTVAGGLDQVGRVLQNASGHAKKAVEQAKTQVHDFSHKVEDFFEDAGDQIADGFQTAGREIQDFFEDDFAGFFKDTFSFLGRRRRALDDSSLPAALISLPSLRGLLAQNDVDAPPTCQAILQDSRSCARLVHTCNDCSVRTRDVCPEKQEILKQYFSSRNASRKTLLALQTTKRLYQKALNMSRGDQSKVEDKCDCLWAYHVAELPREQRRFNVTQLTIQPGPDRVTIVRAVVRIFDAPERTFIVPVLSENNPETDPAIIAGPIAKQALEWYKAQLPSTKNPGGDKGFAVEMLSDAILRPSIA
ncbi:Hypp2521 [Branchiostoma lanceolatum]|uniref:Hypp2521 protein n=1 Tax=Branchiostoma lanceolatum TaxID=7740 RepID=A0A8J9ZRM8_BRALA|nr:Hypp2521 [Branchiostoma lanceolatum]